MAVTHIKLAIYWADKNLPIRYFTCHWTQVQICTHLLTICRRGLKKIWII